MLWTLLATSDSLACIVKCECGFLIVLREWEKKRVKERVEKW